MNKERKRPLCSYRLEKEDRGVVCEESGSGDCTDARFLEAASDRSLSYHDENLRELTYNINGMFAEFVRKNQPKGKRLSILETPDGPILAWVRDFCGRKDDDDRVSIEEALERALESRPR